MVSVCYVSSENLHESECAKFLTGTFLFDDFRVWKCDCSDIWQDFLTHAKDRIHSVETLKFSTFCESNFPAQIVSLKEKIEKEVASMPTDQILILFVPGHVINALLSVQLSVSFAIPTSSFSCVSWNNPGWKVLNIGTPLSTLPEMTPFRSICGIVDRYERYGRYVRSYPEDIDQLYSVSLDIATRLSRPLRSKVPSYRRRKYRGAKLDRQLEEYWKV